jgi:hypothetical protein
VRKEAKSGVEWEKLVKVDKSRAERIREGKKEKNPRDRKPHQLRDD